MSLPERVLVPVRPRDWRHQQATHCGAFAVKAVLNAFGRDPGREPWELHTSVLSRLTGSATSIDYYPAILRSFGVDAEAKNADALPHPDKIDLLRSLLAAGNPVILSIGNHFDRNDGHWRPWRGKVFSHWISVWGYDHAQRVFHTYDPLAHVDDADAPIGNKARTYETLLRIWPGSLPSRRLLGRYAYIDVRGPPA